MEVSMTELEQATEGVHDWIYLVESNRYETFIYRTWVEADIKARKLAEGENVNRVVVSRYEFRDLNWFRDGTDMVVYKGR